MTLERKTHDEIISKYSIQIDQRLFPLTLKSIERIEVLLEELSSRKKAEYVIVSFGQPYGGPTRPLALPKEYVTMIHQAYNKGLKGISPAIGRPYDFNAER